MLGRALIGAGDACMFLNVLRVAAHWLPDRHYALAAALTAACGAFGQLLSTAPLSAALSGIGWTPTFAASGILTAALALFAVSRIQDRPDAPEPTADDRPRRPHPDGRTRAPADHARAQARLAVAGHPPRAVGALHAQRAVRHAHRPVGVPLPRRGSGHRARHGGDAAGRLGDRLRRLRAAAGDARRRAARTCGARSPAASRSRRRPGWPRCSAGRAATRRSS